MPKLYRIVVALPLLALGACQSTGSGMKAMAPGVSGLAFVSVQGPQPEMAKKFEAVLAEEAKSRGYATGSGLQVKTFLDSYAAADGKIGYSWVIDASPDGRARAARAKGTAMLGAAGTPWSGFDDAAMRQVARMGLDDLTRQLASGGTAAPAED